MPTVEYHFSRVRPAVCERASGHLPHEAWHVVQQKQGRVKPMLQAKGLPINTERQLEKEADTQGALAVTRIPTTVQRKEFSASYSAAGNSSFIPFRPVSGVVQLQTMTVVENANIKKDTGENYQTHTKRAISAVATDPFKTKHIRNNVTVAAAKQAVRVRTDGETINTIFQKTEFNTAIGTVTGNYHVKKRHRERLASFKVEREAIARDNGPR